MPMVEHHLKNHQIDQLNKWNISHKLLTLAVETKDQKIQLKNNIKP